jgi:DNA-binding NarL/FixJ family response regulator
MPDISVSIIEDDPAIRSGWAGIINDAPGLHAIAEYGSAEDAIIGIPNKPSDVALVDINLPSLSGIDCVRVLSQRVPAVNFLMLTMYGDRDRIFEALQAGAVGYLLKRSTAAELINAIRQAKQGGAPMSPEIARKVIQFFNQSESTTQIAKIENPIQHKLTERETQTLDLLAAGMHYKEIAEHLGLRIDTVRTYVRGIYEKLQVHSRGEAVAKFFGR